MERLPDHVKGLLITGGGILVLTPDSLLVRLISADAWTLLWWREVLMAIGLAVGLLAVYRGKTVSAFRAVGTDHRQDEHIVPAHCPHSFFTIVQG